MSRSVKNILPKKTRAIKISYERKKNNKTKKKRSSTKKVGGSVSIMKKQSVRKNRSAPIYRGLGYDMLMAYVYLIKEHKDKLCIAIGDKETIKREFDPTYIGLVYERMNNINVLSYHGGMSDLSSFIKRCKKQFFAIPLSMEYPDSGPHFNILIGDKKRRVIERFEPYGAGIDEKVHTRFDEDFKKFLRGNKLYYSYKNPDEFCPAIGLQEIEERNINKKKASVRRNDYRGYCGMWSVWFIEIKMRNKNLSSKEILRKALSQMKEDKKDNKFTFRKFIRNYKDHIVEMRKYIMEEGGVECRDANTGLSPDYFTFKKCAKVFMDKKLDDYF